MPREKLDTRMLSTGKDGRLFIEVNGAQIFFAEVDTFTTNMTFNSVDVQPVGDLTSYAVPTGVAFNLTFTEMLVRDDVNMKMLLDALHDGKIPSYTFQGVIEAPDGEEQRIVYRRCMPSGEFGLQNLTPGEVVKRTQTYRVNSVPEYISTLATRAFGG